MKGLQLLILFAILSLLSCTLKTKDAKEEKTPLELFYGMSDWYAHNETYSDSVLDGRKGLLHREFLTDWYHLGDSIIFPLSLGIYVDENYPTEKIRNVILARLDSMIREDFEYDISIPAPMDLSKVNHVNDYLAYWQKMFDKLKATFSSRDSWSSFSEITGTRMCAVAHQVAVSDNWVTYLFESSVDYHTSCGWTSHADYITLNTETGKALSLDELLQIHPVANIHDTVRDAYEKAVKEKTGEDWKNEDITGELLLEVANGAAIINEGLLIYYHPYNAPQAEGQYNIIVN